MPSPYLTTRIDKYQANDARLLFQLGLTMLIIVVDSLILFSEAIPSLLFFLISDHRCLNVVDRHVHFLFSLDGGRHSKRIDLVLVER